MSPVRKTLAAWAVAAALAVAGVVVVAPLAATTPMAIATASCPAPPLAQNLAAKAVKTETITATVNGKATQGVRFTLAKAAAIDILGYVSAKSPNHTEGGFYWYYDATTWVNWFPSSPCTDPDGFAAGFNARAGRSTNPGGSPRTAVAANFDLYAGLEYDHSTHDFDPVWGLKHYNPQNQGSCADDLGYHFFNDSATGELRTWVRMKVRFLSINYLTQARKTTSEHIELTPAAPLTHGGLGVGAFLESPTAPSGNIIEVPRPGC